MWPHTFAAAFTAKSSETLRRNAVMTPLYTLSLLFIFFAGFAAVLLLPGLPNGDMSLLAGAEEFSTPGFSASSVARARSPPWCRRPLFFSPLPRWPPKTWCALFSLRA